MQDQFRETLRLQHVPDSKSKRWNLSDHGESQKHPWPQELSVSIRISRATARMNEHRPQPCDGERFACAFKKKIRDCACGLRSRRESDHGFRPEGQNKDAHRGSIVAAVGMGGQVWDKGKTCKERSELPDKNRKENKGEL